MDRAVDWNNIRQHRYADAQLPGEWPSHIRPISLKGLTLFAIDPSTNNLYWDGRKVQTIRRLHWPERWIAGVGAASALTIAIVAVGRAAGWWH